MLAPQQIADDLLAAVVALFAEAPAIVLPDRRYVHTGIPAWDCEMLVVSATRIHRSNPAGQGALFVRAPMLDLDIWLLRCCPVVDETAGKIILPTAAELQAAAEERIADAARLAGGITEIIRGIEGCKTTEVGELVPVGPEGGFAGWRQSLSVGL